jgi:hypothetical protein
MREEAFYTAIGQRTVTVEMIKYKMVGIPYCDNHFRELSEKGWLGVRLFQRAANDKLLLENGAPGIHALGFRSYPYFREFKRLNGWK